MTTWINICDINHCISLSLYHSCWLNLPQSSQSAKGLTLSLPPTSSCLSQCALNKADCFPALTHPFSLGSRRGVETLHNGTREIDISRAAMAPFSSATHSIAHAACSVGAESCWESTLCLPGKRSVGGSWIHAHRNKEKCQARAQSRGWGGRKKEKKY